MNPTPFFGRWLRLLLVVLVLAGLGTGGWYAFAWSQPGRGGEPGRPDESGPAPGVVVEVVHPRPGGIRRVSTQPGSVEPLAAAELYAKVSGFLVEQSVDIGSRVERGQTLARIAVPESEKQVERDRAKVNNAKAKVKQMEAHLVAAKAESRAADAAVVLAEFLVKTKTHFREYRRKQLDRIKILVGKEAVDEKLRDEQEEYYMSALESENAARENVNTAQERAAAARARITQAEADVEEARSEVGVAEADLAKSKVWLDYTVVKSPYTGVITRRSFLVGDFIKAADQGGNQPLLAVEATDVMRVVIQVPDRDVPYVRRGVPAVIEIDALPGVVYETRGDKRVEISRWADAEDPTTRTMRTEVDVTNTEGKLRHGMYGRATLVLSEGSPTALRVPSAALVDKAEGGRGSVRVVRDGRIHLVPVRYATDNGVEAEVVTGLGPTDRVVVRAAGPVEEGAPVVVAEENPAGGH